MKTYIDCGINWNWYLEAEIQGDEITIGRHYRLHKDEGVHPETSGAFRLVEKPRVPFSNDPRLVVSVVLYVGTEGRKTYTVTNPKGPFDYR